MIVGPLMFFHIFLTLFVRNAQNITLYIKIDKNERAYVFFP